MGLAANAIGRRGTRSLGAVGMIMVMILIVVVIVVIVSSSGLGTLTVVLSSETWPSQWLVPSQNQRSFTLKGHAHK